MKKTPYLLVIFITLTIIYGCAGYKPIFGSSNLNFKVADYSIKGDKKLGNAIYSKLYSLSKSNENVEGVKDIYVIIHASKEKEATAKNSAGNILGYRIIISTDITVKDFKVGRDILSKNFSYSLTYATQDQFSETTKLENQVIENLINKTYEDLLLNLTDKLL